MLMQGLQNSNHFEKEKQTHINILYLTAGVVLLVIGVALSIFTVVKADDHPGPQAGSVGLTGTMPGKPPTEAAVITNPTNQQHFSSSPITVSGTCPDDTLVELYKSDIFAGSTTCNSDRTFSIEIDLLFGQNNLVAKVFDSLNQQGPDSNIVTVFYDAIPGQSAPLTSMDFSGTQLILITDAVYRGAFPGKEINVPIQIMGGNSPYAVNVQWGDSTNTVFSRSDNLNFSAAHSYSKAGTYQLRIQATDTNGHAAFITVAVIVNGQPSIAATETTTANTGIANKILLLWPLYLGIVAVVISFFLGEKREKHILRERGLLLGQ